MNPNEAQQRAQSELQSNESLYWTGTADPVRASVAALPAAIFGIPFAGFALFWVTQAYHATSMMSKSAHNPFVSGFRVFPLFGLPFLFVGLGIILAPLWALLKSGNTVYAVTNQRVLIITGSTNRTVKSLTPVDILGVDHSERPDGSGDIFILTAGITRASNNMTSQLKVALLGVPNVKQVAQQVMQLHAQRPAA
jgi:hypothetical protein